MDALTRWPSLSSSPWIRWDPQHPTGRQAPLSGIAAVGVLAGLWWHPLGVAAAAGMALQLLGALITHRRAADNGKEMAAALIALAITAAYLVIALAS